jgi:ribosome-associated toxin RatA of RatAB toxin-antitoxin module
MCSYSFAYLIKGYIDIHQDVMMEPAAPASGDAETQMKRYAVARTLPWSCEQLFDLAADVASYPQFLPGWLAVEILEHTPQKLRVRQQLGFGPVNHSFTSSAELQRPRQVFISTTGIELKTGSNLFETALAKLFEVTTPEIIDRFEGRANQLYGQAASTSGCQ